MNTTLTHDDTLYLENLKKDFLSLTNIGILYDKPSRCFSWTDVLSENTQYKHMMIDAFITDLTQGTHSYQYQVYPAIDNFFFNDLQKLWLNIFNTDSLASDLLKMRVTELFNNEPLKFLCHHAMKNNNTSLMLAALDLKKQYPKIYSSGMIEMTLLVEAYQFLLTQNVNIQTVEESFFNHIKVSQMRIRDNVLIDIFLNIFPKERLNRLYHTFNIEKETTIGKIKENCFSMMSLSVRALKVCDLNIFSLTNFLNLCYKEKPKFPLMSVLKEDGKHIYILFETELGNEKKIKMLFEHMVEKQIIWNLQKDKVFELIDKISEVVDLDSAIKESKASSIKQKI